MIPKDYKLEEIENVLTQLGYSKIREKRFRNDVYEIRLNIFRVFGRLIFENIKTGKQFDVALHTRLTEPKLKKFLNKVNEYIADPKIELSYISEKSLTKFTSFKRTKLFEAKGFEIELYQLKFLAYEITYRHKETGYRFRVKFETYCSAGEIHFFQFDRRFIVPYEILAEFLQNQHKKLTELSDSTDTGFVEDIQEIKRFTKEYGYEVAYFTIYNENWLITWTGNFRVYSLKQPIEFCVTISLIHTFSENLKILLNALKNQEITNILILESRGY